jgi:tetratricopeptide (TPR) repeat protein
MEEEEEDDDDDEDYVLPEDGGEEEGGGNEEDLGPWCLCEQVSYGTMIGCDNENCPIEWFHLSCVGLKDVQDTWFCPECCFEATGKEYGDEDDDEEAPAPKKKSSSSSSSRASRSTTKKTAPAKKSHKKKADYEYEDDDSDLGDFSTAGLNVDESRHLRFSSTGAVLSEQPVLRDVEGEDGAVTEETARFGLSDVDQEGLEAELHRLGKSRYALPQWDPNALLQGGVGEDGSWEPGVGSAAPPPKAKPPPPLVLEGDEVVDDEVEFAILEGRAVGPARKPPRNRGNKLLQQQKLQEQSQPQLLLGGSIGAFAEPNAVEQLWGPGGGGPLSKAARKAANKAQPVTGMDGKRLPRALEVMLAEAHTFYIEGKYLEATTKLGEVVRQNPKLPDPYQTMGLIYEDTGDLNRALAMYFVAASNTAAHLARPFWTKVSAMAYDLGQYRRSLVATDKALRHVPVGEIDQGLSQTKLLLSLRMESFKKVESQMKKYAQRFPDDRDFVLECGDVYKEMGRPDRAMLCYSQYFLSYLRKTRPQKEEGALGGGGGEEEQEEDEEQLLLQQAAYSKEAVIPAAVLEKLFYCAVQVVELVFDATVSHTSFHVGSFVRVDMDVASNTVAAVVNYARTRTPPLQVPHEVVLSYILVLLRNKNADVQEVALKTLRALLQALAIEEEALRSNVVDDEGDNEEDKSEEAANAKLAARAALEDDADLLASRIGICNQRLRVVQELHRLGMHTQALRMAKDVLLLTPVFTEAAAVTSSAAAASGSQPKPLSSNSRNAVALLELWSECALGYEKTHNFDSAFSCYRTAAALALTHGGLLTSFVSPAPAGCDVGMQGSHSARIVDVLSKLCFFGRFSPLTTANGQIEMHAIVAKQFLFPFFSAFAASLDEALVYHAKKLEEEKAAASLDDDDEYYDTAASKRRARKEEEDDGDVEGEEQPDCPRDSNSHHLTSVAAQSLLRLLVDFAILSWQLGDVDTFVAIVLPVALSRTSSSSTRAIATGAEAGAAAANANGAVEVHAGVKMKTRIYNLYALQTSLSVLRTRGAGVAVASFFSWQSASLDVVSLFVSSLCDVIAPNSTLDMVLGAQALRLMLTNLHMALVAISQARVGAGGERLEDLQKYAATFAAAGVSSSVSQEFLRQQHRQATELQAILSAPSSSEALARQQDEGHAATRPLRFALVSDDPVEAAASAGLSVPARITASDYLLYSLAPQRREVVRRESAALPSVFLRGKFSSDLHESLASCGGVIGTNEPPRLTYAQQPLASVLAPPFIVSNSLGQGETVNVQDLWSALTGSKRGRGAVLKPDAGAANKKPRVSFSAQPTPTGTSSAKAKPKGRAGSGSGDRAAAKPKAKKKAKKRVKYADDGSDEDASGSDDDEGAATTPKSRGSASTSARTKKERMASPRRHASGTIFASAAAEISPVAHAAAVMLANQAAKKCTYLPSFVPVFGGMTKPINGQVTPAIVAAAASGAACAREGAFLTPAHEKALQLALADCDERGIKWANMLAHSVLSQPETQSEPPFSSALHAKLPLHYLYKHRTLGDPSPNSLANLVLAAHDQVSKKHYGDALRYYCDAYILDGEQPLVCLCMANLLLFMGHNLRCSDNSTIIFKAFCVLDRYRVLRLAHAEKLRQNPPIAVDGVINVDPLALEQEVAFNIGRALHELRLYGLARESYVRCLEIAEQMGNPVEGEALTLTREAAHNLVLIYRRSGNVDLAYCTMKRWLSI